MGATDRLGVSLFLIAGLAGLGLHGCLASSTDEPGDVAGVEQGANRGDDDTGDGDGALGDGDGASGDGDDASGDGDGDGDSGDGDSSEPDGDSGDGDGDSGDGDSSEPDGDSGDGDGDSGDSDPVDAGVPGAGFDAGPGTPGDLCGTRGAAPCQKDEYCDFPPRSMCGATDLGGTCRPLHKDILCIQVYDPVCGCDGKTYGNACEAGRVGVSISARGECDQVGDTCGGIAGLSCGRGEFCNYGQDAGGQGCDGTIADAAGVCQEQPRACARDYNPVCGCDRHTYSNACSAHAAGASVMRDDLCTDDDCERIGGRVAFGQGPPPRCRQGETSAGAVRLVSGAIPTEGAICCL